jgi:hypothetical protein
MTMRPPANVQWACLDELLAQPDPPELPPRRHHLTVAGRADRNETLVLPLVTAYMAWRYLETHGEVSYERTRTAATQGRHA